MVQALRNLGMPLYGCAAADRLQHDGRRVGQHGRAAQPHELRAAAGERRRAAACRAGRGGPDRRSAPRPPGRAGQPQPRPDRPAPGTRTAAGRLATRRAAQLGARPAAGGRARARAGHERSVARSRSIDTMLGGAARRTATRADARRAPTTPQQLRGADARIAGVSETRRRRSPGDHIMMTRRIFLKNGSLGPRQPRLRAGVHRARGAGGAGAQEDPDRDLPARRRGRPQHGRARSASSAYYAGRPSIAIPRPGRARTARSISTASSACIRAWRRSRRLFKRRRARDRARLRIADETRSHFDAQDYMESGTPGVKSTRDGWMNRYLHAKEHAEGERRSAPSRSRRSCRARCRARRRRSRSASSASSASAPAQDSDMMATAFEAQYAQAADTLLGPTGKEAFDAVKMLKDANPARLHAGQRRRVSALGLRRRDAADRADRQVRPRPRSRVRRTRPVGPPRQRGQLDAARSRTASTTSRAASPRSHATWATAWPTSSSSRCPSSAAR